MALTLIAKGVSAGPRVAAARNPAVSAGTQIPTTTAASRDIRDRCSFSHSTLMAASITPPALVGLVHGEDQVEERPLEVDPGRVQRADDSPRCMTEIWSAIRAISSRW